MKETNLQIFVKLFAEFFTDKEEINDFIIENFNNQDANSYLFDGTLYYLFDKDDVEEQLDEDFEIEIMELIDFIKYREFGNLVKPIETALSINYNYKTVKNDFDTLLNYGFKCSGDGIYIYTKK